MAFPRSLGFAKVTRGVGDGVLFESGWGGGVFAGKTVGASEFFLYERTC